MGVREQFVRILSRSGMAQAELARRLGVKRTWVHRRVSGQVAIAADDVPRIAEATGVSILEFYADGHAPHPDTAGFVTEELTRYMADAYTPEGRFAAALAELLRSYRERGGTDQP